MDRHHAGLLHSLQLLLEDRLGYLVYVPIGHEWWDEGYWQFGQGYGDDRLAQQFLSMDGWTQNDLGTWTTFDPHYPERAIFGVTLAQFREVPGEWSHVIASVQDNQLGFSRLAQEQTERAARAPLSWPDHVTKFVLQVGNVNADIDWRLDPIALISSEHQVRGRGVIYRQEFDSDGLFEYRQWEGSGIVSMMNCFSSVYCHRWFEEAKALLPEVSFREHGIDGADGNINDIRDQARVMGEAAWGWHCKPQGDGFGHTVHGFAALGRPLIGHASHYKGLMAEPFWRDMETCIDLDRHPIDEVADIIRTITPDAYWKMSYAIGRTFHELVDWDRDAQAVRAVLEAGA